MLQGSRRVLCVVFLIVGVISCSGTKEAPITDSKESSALEHYRTGVFHLRAGEFRDAAVELERAIKLDPSLGAAYRELGLAYLSIGEFEEALDATRKARQLDDSDVDILANLGSIHAAMDQYEEALEYYTLVLEYPGYATAENIYFNMGAIYLRQEKYVEAESQFRKAIALNQVFAEAHNLLGEALMALGQIDEALTSFDKALLEQPQLAQAILNRGLVFVERGDKDAARKEFRKAMNLGAGTSVGTRAREELLSMGVSEDGDGS